MKKNTGSIDAKLAFRYLFVRIVLLFVALLTLVFIWLSQDLLKSFNLEKQEWDQYRSYGLVRSLGVEFIQELESTASKQQNVQYDKILKNILSFNNEVDNLALLQNSGALVAIEGVNQEFFQNLILQNTIKFPVKDVNYDNNVSLQKIFLQNFSNLNNQEIDLGVLNIEAPDGQVFNLVVGFKPLQLENPENSLFLVSFSIIAAISLMVWQIFAYTFQRQYQEPVGYLDVIANELNSGRWPAAHPVESAKAFKGLEKLAIDCISRCQIQWSHLQWQLQKMRQSLPHQDAALSSLSNTMESKCFYIRSVIPAIVAAHSLAVFQLRCFVAAVISSTVLVTPQEKYWVMHAFLLFFMLLSFLLTVPRNVLLSVIFTLLRGTIAGILLGGVFHNYINYFSLMSSQSLNLMVYGVCALTYVCLIAFGLTYRKKLV